MSVPVGEEGRVGRLVKLTAWRDSGSWLNGSDFSFVGVLTSRFRRVGSLRTPRSRGYQALADRQPNGRAETVIESEASRHHRLAMRIVAAQTLANDPRVSDRTRACALSGGLISGRPMGQGAGEPSFGPASGVHPRLSTASHGADHHVVVRGAVGRLAPQAPERRGARFGAVPVPFVPPDAPPKSRGETGRVQALNPTGSLQLPLQGRLPTPGPCSMTKGLGVVAPTLQAGRRGLGRHMTNRELRLTKLVNQHLGFVERVLRNMGVPDADLDDAVQRTFIVVANRLDDIVVGAEKSFLFRSAKHMASHVRRSASRHSRLEPFDDDVPVAQQSPEQLVSQKKARELLDELLDSMPEELRLVFSLYEFEGLRMPEIAEYLEIPTGTVASRLRRARKHFQAGVRRFEAVSTFAGAKAQRRVGS